MTVGNLPGRKKVRNPAIRAMAVFLYSEGVVANDRICGFINSISGDVLGLSEGSVYGVCQRFGKVCASLCPEIKKNLLNSHEICTDATTMKTDGKQSYIRNFSTKTDVLYIGSGKKDLDTLKGMGILEKFAGVLTYDHIYNSQAESSSSDFWHSPPPEAAENAVPGKS